MLQRMLEQEFITRAQYEEAVAEDVPSEQQVDPPQPDSDQPYFTSWLTQQLVDRYKAPAVFSGGLKVRTTLDPELQAAAEQAVEGRLAGVGPSASLVAIENKTGEVKAMVGGTDFERRPFNLATNGHRQPGSAFKPFTLVRALQDGVSPDATFTSAAEGAPGPQGRPVRGEQLRGQLRRRGQPALRHRHLGQLRLRRAGPGRGHQAHRQARRSGWACAPRSPPTGP